MKPRQKCGSDHWLTEDCPKGICERKVSRSSEEGQPPIDLDELAKTARVTSARLVIDPRALDEDGFAKAISLTPAEKQKRWRNTGDVEGKRERDKLRKRAERRKRDGD